MKVKIELITCRRQDGENEETRLSAKGILRENGTVLAYTEPEGAAVRVHADGGCVTVERHGDMRSRLVFVKGERCACRYDTPYGALPMEAVCTAMEGSLSNRLFVAYTLEVGAGEPLVCTMEFLTEEVSE